MGIDVHIAPRSRDDVEVSDTKNIFAGALASAHLETTLCLRFIDPYGETLFNSLQLPVLLDELQALGASTTHDDTRTHMQRLVRLVRDAIGRGPHHFIRCVGD